MASWVLRAMTTTASVSGEGFSSRWGHVGRHVHVVAGRRLEAHLGVAVEEHEHRWPRAT